MGEGKKGMLTGVLRMSAPFIGNERCIGVVCAHDADDDAMTKEGRGAGGWVQAVVAGGECDCDVTRDCRFAPGPPGLGLETTTATVQGYTPRRGGQGGL